MVAYERSECELNLEGLEEESEYALVMIAS